MLAVPGDASAGTIAFSSARCENAADLDRRPAFTVPKSEGRCRDAIWLVEDDGAGLRRITEGGNSPSGADRDPDWSPDGLRLVYQSSGSPAPLHVALADGSGARPVTPVLPDGRALLEPGGPAWSPAGSRIVVSARAPDDRQGNFDLFTMNADGSGVTQLTFTTNASERSPNFAPDGGRVLFTRSGLLFSNTGMLLERNPENEGVFTISTDGRIETRLTAGDVPPGWGAVFSPDGRSIALSLFGLLYTMDADGSNLRQRTTQPGPDSPAWAGLGSTLIYPKPASASRFESRSQLVKLDLTREGAQPEPITTPAAGSDQQPDWRLLPSVGGALPPVDELAPVVRLVDSARHTPIGPGGGPRASAARRVPSVRRRDLDYLAVDGSGIRALDVAVVRRAGRRCRYLSSGGFTRPRRCGRPVYRRVRNPADWRRTVDRLIPQTYAFRFRTRDRRGNVSARAGVARLQLTR
jgi:Tol biopolymer transport system component